jgi:hypothetical protein
MTEVVDEFDFRTWAARSYGRKAGFYEVLAAAIEQMVIGRGNLRDRLSHALFVLCLDAGELDVPREFRKQFDELLASVNRPLDRDTDIGEWTDAISRMRFKKADSLAWKLWQLHRAAARRGT